MLDWAHGKEEETQQAREAGPPRDQARPVRTPLDQEEAQVSYYQHRRSRGRHTDTAAIGWFYALLFLPALIIGGITWIIASVAHHAGIFIILGAFLAILVTTIAAERLTRPRRREIY